MAENIYSVKMNNACSGCGACYAVCPSGCILIQKNSDGFFEASVVESLCTSCGACSKVCYALNRNAETMQVGRGRFFAANSKNIESLNKCSAGGIAYEISKQTIDAGGMAIGSFYDAKDNILKSNIAISLNDINKISGAKYLQTSSAAAFKEAVNIAINNPKAFFAVFGTPCQIYGMNSVIREKQIENQFILIETFCSGFVSYEVWNSYLDEVKKKFGKIPDTVLFDYDKQSDKCFQSMSFFYGNKQYDTYIWNDSFLKIINDGLLINPVCRNCIFKAKKTVADIRLAKMLGSRFEKHKGRVGGVIVFTNKGIRLLKALNNISILGEYDVNECIHSQQVFKINNYSLYETALGKIKTGESLRKVVKFYRSKLPKSFMFIYFFEKIKAFFLYKIKKLTRGKGNGNI